MLLNYLFYKFNSILHLKFSFPLKAITAIPKNPYQNA